MKTYIDCGSGIAGDMMLGAFIGLGLSPRILEKTLRSALGEKDLKLKVRRTERRQWPAWSVQVIGDRPYGSIEKMRSLVQRAALPGRVKMNAIEILNRLENAEKQAHGKSKGDFDPQGLGLLDTLVDVVGNCWGFWKLDLKEDALASPLNTGRVAPATAIMLQQAAVPIYSTEPGLELATPTGVAILLQFVQHFRPMPEMKMEKSGYGAGAADPQRRPNVVAIYQGVATAHELESVLLLETVIDDMDPRLYPYVSELLLKQGALDVWWTPVGMKKGRPGLSLTVLCKPAEEAKMMTLLFRETTTLGVRRLPVERWTLPRRTKGLKKSSFLPDGEVKTQTEFEVAKKLAASRAIPLLKLLK